jgi:hypothetical protein
MTLLKCIPGGLDKVTSLRSEMISKSLSSQRYPKQFGRQCYIVVAIVMVNCLNVKKYILSIIGENFQSVSVKMCLTLSQNHVFAIVFKLLLCLSPRE